MRKSFNVFGATVPIKKLKLTEETAMIAGLYNPATQEIFINEGLNKKDIPQTLMHELGHAIIYRTGLDQILSAEAQEIICENFAEFVTENYTLKRNLK